jgi:broad specificity phosphatase PhoE
MTAVIILCRHGNTFERGARACMVGAREDLPLTQEGREQARRMGMAIASTGVVVNRVLCGPLQRTKVYSQIIVERLGSGLQPATDSRLVELDYGEWGGLSNEEIAERFGADVLAAWNERGVRPIATPFSPTEDVVERETLAVLADLGRMGGVSLLVTSNGRLREYSRLIAPEGRTSHKVKTGNACVLMQIGDSWRILGWDLSPELVARGMAIR